MGNATENERRTTKGTGRQRGQTRLNKVLKRGEVYIGGGKTARKNSEGRNEYEFNPYNSSGNEET